MHIVVTMTKYCEKLELQQHLQNFDLWDILCFYGRLCCLSINLLWGPDEYIVAKIPSKFHTNRTSIMAVMFSNRQEKGGLIKDILVYFLQSQNSTNMIVYL